MSEFKRTKRETNKQQQAKLKQRQSQRIEPDYDDDDEGGGGHGKSMLGHFKLETLLKALEKGRYKAEQFWRFLNKEGLDAHEVEKTELEKQAETKEDVADKTAAEEKAQADSKIEDVIERTLEHEGAGEERAWEKAPAAEDERHRYSFLDQTDTTNADATRRSVMGDKLAGSVISGTTNPLGFGRQAEIAGAVDFSAGADMERKAAIGAGAQSWIGQDAEGQSAKSLDGSGMQGSVTNANYLGNAQGVAARQIRGGALFNPLAKNTTENVVADSSPKVSQETTAPRAGTGKK